jgi:hypothetical protein
MWSETLEPSVAYCTHTSVDSEYFADKYYVHTGTSTCSGLKTCKSFEVGDGSLHSHSTFLYILCVRESKNSFYFFDVIMYFPLLEDLQVGHWAVRHEHMALSRQRFLWMGKDMAWLARGTVNRGTPGGAQEYEPIATVPFGITKAWCLPGHTDDCVELVSSATKSFNMNISKIRI